MTDDLFARGVARAGDTKLVEAGRGVPSTPGNVGLTAADVKATFPKAMYYRSRYTVLDLARETGWFDDLVDEVFGPGGLWRRSP